MSRQQRHTPLIAEVREWSWACSDAALGHVELLLSENQPAYFNAQ
jgi:hypothetical protein